MDITDRTMERSTTMFGITVHHEFACFFNFEHILNKYGPFDYIIEFGTAGGGLSLYLHFQQLIRDKKFITFDVHPRKTGHTDKDPAIIFEKVSLNYKLQNIFDEPAIKYIKEIIDSCDKVLVYCDNGNKPRELRTYAPMLKCGSVIGFDDWLTEIHPHNVNPICKQYNLTEIANEFTEGYKTLQRFYIMR